MTESVDTTTNSSRCDCDNNDYPPDFSLLPIDQQKHIDDEYGLFNNADEEDNLTLFDLKPTRKSDPDLSIFDELVHQCDAVLFASNLQAKLVLSITPASPHSSSLLTTTTMINDYERRFQRSLQKLTVPSWYNDIVSSSRLSRTPPIISSNHYKRESRCTPEIVSIHRPHSYRSCRSSIGTSPSPSLHSWHPNHMINGISFPPLVPSSSSTSRRSNKYEKGIERVTRSSHWYQPTPFAASTSTSRIERNKTSDSNLYDVPKFHAPSNNLEDHLKQSLTPVKGLTSKLSIQRQANCLIDDIDFDDVENTCITEQNNNYHKDNIFMAHDKEQNNSIRFNEIPSMPLVNEKIAFGRIELEEVTDEEENDKRSSTNNMHIPSTVERNVDDETNTTLECLASRLAESILTDVLLLETLEHDDEINMGVRELSDDENALRELDENDMSGTDEFILFATKPLTSDEDKEGEKNNGQTTPTINRGSLNRLYTFSRANNDGPVNNSKKGSSNQDSSTSELMTVDKNLLTTNSHSNPDANESLDWNRDDSNNPLPIYRSHIQKRHLNLGRYYDGMMRAKTSQLPTHDLRCNLVLNEERPLQGVTEETVRKGRILLDQIPNSIELKTEMTSDQSSPVRSILKNIRFASVDDSETKIPDDRIVKIEEQEKLPLLKIITTITEEYHRIHRKTIEEFDEELPEVIPRDLDYSNNRERVHLQQSLIASVPRNEQSPYELLSECYSGYSLVRNQLSIPIKAPFISNVSSLQTTTDEAYESETTISPRSPTVSSSTAATTMHVHPDLEHEFEYPSPPPPVPDRRLKPTHLRPPPPTKPRYQKQQIDSSDVYSQVQKPTTGSPLVAIQHLISFSTDDPNSTSSRTLSSRHYCGSLPLSNEPTTSSSSDTPKQAKLAANSKRTSKTRNSSGNDNQQIKFKKSSSSPLTKNRSKKSASACFNEATNGLAIRLPASQSHEEQSSNKQNLSRSSTISAGKRSEGTTKHRPVSENLNSHRSSVYETSV